MKIGGKGREGWGGVVGYGAYGVPNVDGIMVNIRSGDKLFFSGLITRNNCKVLTGLNYEMHSGQPCS